MILVDTCIWVDHFRRADRTLAALLDANRVLVHPFIIGELSLGTLRNRTLILQSLEDLPQSLPAREDEVKAMIDRYALHSRGIGYIDAHLLASAKLTAAKLWTRDKRLQQVSETLGLFFKA